MKEQSRNVWQTVAIIILGVALIVLVFLILRPYPDSGYPVNTDTTNDYPGVTL